MKERLKRLRLLPRDPEIGWTAYVWLVYLLPFVAFPAFAGAGALEWLRVLSGLALFLLLYFSGFWSTGMRLVLIIAGITAIGAFFLPSNRGAAVFFIYAASFAAWVKPSLSVAVRVITAVVLVLLAEALYFRLEVMQWGWGVLFAVLVGAINIHGAQTSRNNARLRLAHHEIEGLAKAAERERIARDLHDVLGHTLSVIVLKSELASKLAELDPARAIAEIRDVEKISREALTQVRASVAGYRSTGLDTELETAAETLATASVRMQLMRAEGVDFTESESAVLALVVREAITNVLRHARASACIVTITADALSRRLSIEDDGGARTAKEGMGLTGMRERVEAIDGRLEISQGSGMKLVVTLPAAGAEVPA